MLHDYAEMAYWNQGASLAIGLLCACSLLAASACLLAAVVSNIKPGVCIWGASLWLVIGVGSLVPVATYESEIKDSAPVQSYISEEHRLADAGYAREQVGEGSGSGSLFYYASEVKIENVSMLQYVRQADDGALTFHTWPMDEVKIYESDTQAPMERHHHSRKVLVNPFTGEEEYVDDRLDYVEITVPAGSVARNYDLSVHSGN
ncbi:hypothetical protein ACN08Y_10120 [Rothia sp. P5764]|uniref:hypothetical protein n=1 Tax=Rothia sp. P5764 TaxID=3402654 RepID=UPI003ABEC1BD